MNLPQKFYVTGFILDAFVVGYDIYSQSWNYISYPLACMIAFVFAFILEPKPVKASEPVKPIETVPNPQRDKKLSWPAEQVINSYDNLPDEHKAMGDIRMTLEALDVKYGHPSVINRHFMAKNPNYERDVERYERYARYSSFSHHFDATYPNRTTPSFDCDCEGTCRMPEYGEFMNVIKEIDDEYTRQQNEIRLREAREKRALELAGVEAEISSVPLVIQALRDEREAIKSRTEELA